MDKEEYIQKKNSLMSAINELTEEYVKSNSRIPNGTKVKITQMCSNVVPEKVYAVHYGYLVGYHCEFDEVRPIIKKLKKDGTPSMVNLWFSGINNSKIEVL